MSELDPLSAITPEEAALLRSSFLKLIPRSEEASLVFYEGLFSRMPSTRGMFSQEIRVQGEKFMMMLAVMLDALDKPAKLDAECKSLAASHSRYGVTTEMFDVVGEALMDSFQRSLGAEFDNAVRSSWTKLYGIAASAMKDAQVP